MMRHQSHEQHKLTTLLASALSTTNISIACSISCPPHLGHSLNSWDECAARSASALRYASYDGGSCISSSSSSSSYFFFSSSFFFLILLVISFFLIPLRLLSWEACIHKPSQAFSKAMVTQTTRAPKGLVPCSEMGRLGRWE